MTARLFDQTIVLCCAVLDSLKEKVGQIQYILMYLYLYSITIELLQSYSLVMAQTSYCLKMYISLLVARKQSRS